MFHTDNSYKFVKCSEHALDSLINDEDRLFSSDIWQIDYLKKLSVDLNDVKSQLDDKDIEEWGRHTALTDVSSFIRRDIRERLQVEPELLTRAWLKFYEIISMHDVISFGEDERETKCSINGLFLCEAPGAFITAANHFIKSTTTAATVQRAADFIWFASTLNPYHEGSDVFGAAIIDDALIGHPLTFQNWRFGEDNTGNIMSSSFFSELNRLGLRNFDFVTADGGVSCAADPARQELSTLPLIFAETLAALLTLRVNGNFVLKAFSLLEGQSVCLVYFLYLAFKEVNLYKPLASKAGNSEIYLVCKGLTHATPTVVKSLLSKVEQFTGLLEQKALFKKEDIPLDFLLQYQEALSHFTHYQKKAIETNLRLHLRMNSNEKRELHLAKKSCSQAFFQRCKLSSVDANLMLTRGLPNDSVRLWKRFGSTFDGLRSMVQLKGSLVSRRSSHGEVDNNLKLYTELERIGHAEVLNEKLGNWIQCRQSMLASNCLVSKMKIIRGTRSQVIKCSKFVDPSLLNLYNRYKFDSCLSGSKNLFLEASNEKASEKREAIEKMLSDYIDGLVESPKFVIDCAPGTSQLGCQLSGLLRSSRYQISGLMSLTIDQALGQCKQFSGSGTAKIHVIDPTVAVYSKSAPRALLPHHSGSNAVKEQEAKNPKEFLHVTQLVRQLHLLLPILGPRDLVVVHLECALSRLAVNVLFLVSRLFDEFSVVPCYPSCTIWSGDSSPPIRGQLFLFKRIKNQIRVVDGNTVELSLSCMQQASSEARDFEAAGAIERFDEEEDFRLKLAELASRVALTLKELEADLVKFTPRLPDDKELHLLEVVPTAVVLQDTVFSEALFAANVTQLAEELKCLVIMSETKSPIAQADETGNVAN